MLNLKITSGALSVWSRNFLYYRKTWTVSLFWTVLEPLLLLGAIGFGLGSYVNNMTGKSFVEFFFPGLLCSTAMMVGFFECTYSTYTKLATQKTLNVILMTPISAEDIAIGEILWGSTKGIFGALGVVLVSSVFGLIDSWRIIPALIVVWMISVMFACIGLIVTCFAKNYDSFIYATSGFIMPMSLLAGTYFPISDLPGYMKIIAYFLPLTHGVAAVRSILFGKFEWQILAHLFITCGLLWVLLPLAVRKLHRRLVK